MDDEAKGLKQVEMWGSVTNIKLQLFCCCGTMTDEFLSPQQIYQDKLSACLPHHAYISKWHVTCSPNGVHKQYRPLSCTISLDGHLLKENQKTPENNRKGKHRKWKASKETEEQATNTQEDSTEVATVHPKQQMSGNAGTDNSIWGNAGMPFSRPDVTGSCHLHMAVCNCNPRRHHTYTRGSSALVGSVQ